METIETTVLVEYLGNKDRKEDNVSGSGVVWRGHGDVQPVTAAQWGALSKHDEVWRKVDSTEGKTTSGSLPAALLADGSKAAEAAKALSLDGAQDSSAPGLTVEQVHAHKFSFTLEEKSDSTEDQAHPKANGSEAPTPATKPAATKPAGKGKRGAK